MVARHPVTHRSRRYLLRDPDGDEMVARLAGSQGWETVVDIPAKRFGSEPGRVSWEMYPGIFLTCVRDRKLHTSYLLVTSRITDGLGSYETWITASGLSFFTDADLIRAVEGSNNPKEKCRALVRAGIGAPLNPDNRYSRVFIESVNDASPDVRKSAIKAIGYTEWPPFQELLDAISQQDPDGSVRSLAKRMSAAFDEAEVGDE
ncbi:hypothetical protein [Streptomyces lavenduligriseus]|uniref:HEAT repeat domain-containing protein n=1 Tax=Streptomyces lavenduligriseus TaxID=67315 RepID=A0ABT0NTA2_9ACTN|nr:hypothetical protein [Streptomyces lavenduligriseus]MCL3994698.1 hypothetical protein [Streptomyces lavenduligriseus]